MNSVCASNSLEFAWASPNANLSHCWMLWVVCCRSRDAEVSLTVSWYLSLALPQISAFFSFECSCGPQIRLWTPRAVTDNSNGIAMLNRWRSFTAMIAWRLVARPFAKVFPFDLPIRVCMSPLFFGFRDGPHPWDSRELLFVGNATPMTVKWESGTRHNVAICQMRRLGNPRNRTSTTGHPTTRLIPAQIALAKPKLRLSEEIVEFSKVSNRIRIIGSPSFSLASLSQSYFLQTQSLIRITWTLLLRSVKPARPFFSLISQ